MSALEKQNIAIVTVKMTTDGINECRGTQEIIVEAEHEHLFQEKALCRVMPTEQLMIVRTHDGKYLRRKGGVNVGVSLTSYLYGKTHMRRVDPKDVEDYTLGAFVPDSGKHQSIEVLLHKEAFNAVSTIWHDEEPTEKEEVVMTDAEKKVDLTVSLKPFKPVMQMSIPDLNAELVDIVNRINAAKKMKIPANKKANCPCCGVEFKKSHGIQIFCSSSRDGKAGCKDELNARKTDIRKAIVAKGGTVDPAGEARPTKPSKSQPQAAVSEQPKVVQQEVAKDNSDTFKVIGGVPFTLEETKELLFQDNDRDNFKEYRGITFSLAEFRKLVLE